jgi:excisionase family DNA binding protein
MAADVMTKDQARRYLHISLATLDRWIEKGLIPVVKLERRVLIRKAALDQVLRDHERVATPAALRAHGARQTPRRPSERTQF